MLKALLSGASSEGGNSAFERSSSGTGTVAPALDVAAVPHRNLAAKRPPQEDPGGLGFGHLTAQVDRHLLAEGAQVVPQAAIELHGQYAKAIHRGLIVARSSRAVLRRRSAYIRKPLTTIIRSGYRGLRG
jgi:hypothetical protein